MQVSMCLAYQPVQLELSIFGKSINFSLEDPRHNERLSLTLSHTRVEALTEGLQAALQAMAEKKPHADITVKRLWEKTDDAKTGLVNMPTHSSQLTDEIEQTPADQAA